MAVYFDQRLDTDYNAVKNITHWHKAFTILAVASHTGDNGGQVCLYTEEGEYVKRMVQEKSCQITQLAWHPNKKLLAIGWETGEVTIRNAQDDENHEAAHVLKSAVSVLAWSSNGMKLATGDKSGNLVVWRTDAKGRVQASPLCQHNLSEPLMSIVFIPPETQNSDFEMAQLAKAAVSGDERALDMFQSKRGGKGGKPASSESPGFFVGGASGGVYYVSENGRYSNSFHLEGGIKWLLYYGERSILIAITESLSCSQYSVLPEGETKEIIKVKLSGKVDSAEIIWAGKGILATCTSEFVVRMWDLDSEENYVLTLEGNSGYDSNEGILSIAYSNKSGVLAGGTNMGNVAMWKYSPPTKSRKVEPEDKWQLQGPTTVEGPVRQLEWGSARNLLAVNTLSNTYILSEAVMNSSFKEEVAVIQVGPSLLTVDMFASGGHHSLKTDLQVKGIYTSKEALVV